MEIVLLGLLEDVPLAVRQHDKAPVHCGEDVQQWLNTTYPGRWIGCQGPIAWPPWLLDLTLMDFFLWGHLKEHIYAVPPSTIENLMARMQAVVTAVKVCSRECCVGHCHLP
jgi:hypothetical protein